MDNEKKEINLRVVCETKVTGGSKAYIAFLMSLSIPQSIDVQMFRNYGNDD